MNETKGVTNKLLFQWDQATDRNFVFRSLKIHVLKCYRYFNKLFKNFNNSLRRNIVTSKKISNGSSFKLSFVTLKTFHLYLLAFQQKCKILQN